MEGRKGDEKRGEERKGKREKKLFFTPEKEEILK